MCMYNARTHTHTHTQTHTNTHTHTHTSIHFMTNLVIADTSDTRKTDRYAIGGVGSRLAELCPSNFPNLTEIKEIRPKREEMT